MKLKSIAGIRKKLFGTYGKYSVYLVDGKEVRDSSLQAQEFGGIAHYHDFPELIPENEIWLENAVDPVERNIEITSALYQLRLIDSGVPADEAYKRAMRVENHAREEFLLSNNNPELTDEPAPDEVYVRQYKNLNGIKVFLIDADVVRDYYKTDFIEGGHGYVYDFIPLDEVWIEDRLDSQEIPYVLLHELVERMLMKNMRIEYNTAHDIAAHAEYDARESEAFA